MKKAAAKLMFLCALFLITNICWTFADTTNVKRMTALLGTPGQPPPRPGPVPNPGPSAPDGANPPLCPPGSSCAPSLAPR
jgi:hypothetical protein